MDTSRERIFVFGASGHAKVVVDVIERQGVYQIAFLADDDPRLRGSRFYGYEILGGRDDLLQEENRPNKAIVAIGSNTARTKVASWLEAHGFDLISAVHPSVQLARGAAVGAGTVLMPNVTINSDVSIGKNTIINTKASVDHDCIVGHGCHIGPGAVLCGSIHVGDGTFVGAGSTIIPNIKIGKNVVVGAGATVVKDVADGATVVGTPARVVVR